MASGGTVLAGGTWPLPPCAAGGVFAPRGDVRDGVTVPHQGRRCCSTAAGVLSPVQAFGCPWCIFWETRNFFGQRLPQSASSLALQEPDGVLILDRFS